MLQTLFYIPGELFGLPVFGFGLLLAVWAVAGTALLVWQVRRHGFNGDTSGHIQLLAVLGIAIAFVLPWLCEARGLPIRGYGMMMLLAVLAGLGLAAHRARRSGVDPEMIFLLAFWMILPGIIGARVVYVVEYWPDQFLPAYKEGLPALLVSVINVPKGGLVVYGAFFGGMVGLALFWWRYRVPLLATADLIAPSMLLGLALGRVGCLFNGCCYGGPCELPWKVTFPWNSPVHQHQAKEGFAGVLDLKFGNGPNHRPVIESFDTGSPAAQRGLRAGMEIEQINGIDVKSSEQPHKENSSFGCSCSQESTGTTAKEQAASVVLGIDRINLKFRGMRDEVSLWTDDPPAWQVDGSGPLRIYGLEFAGSDDQEPVVRHVRRQSYEASVGIHEGQRVESISSRRVTTIGQLRKLLDEHRQHPWLRILPAGDSQPIELPADRPLPRSLPVHPTQLYSTIDALVLCFLLLTYDRFRRRDGALTALMMTIYPITRFLIESIRTDEQQIWGTGLHISQNISLGILAVAAGLWIYILRQPAELAFGGSGGENSELKGNANSR
jgi:prolipoprotein diacylglyceryltransferase